MTSNEVKGWFYDFAASAQLSPMVAAILMPISSISIVALSALLSFLLSATIRSQN
jgi:cation transport ATPase